MNDYVKFGLCVAGLCLVFPPLLGLFIGVAVAAVIFTFFFKLLGG